MLLSVSSICVRHASLSTMSQRLRAPTSFPIACRFVLVARELLEPYPPIPNHPAHAAEIRSKQRDPKPKDNSLIRKEASTHKGFHSTFAALFSYSGVFVRVRVPLFATQEMKMARTFATAAVLLLPALGLGMDVSAVIAAASLEGTKEVPRNGGRK